jgi:VIT1/CCC1 family predicted Fe2+/Mn2+ transporter
MHEIDMEREEVRRESNHHLTIPERESHDLKELLINLGLSESTSTSVVNNVNEMQHDDKVRFHARVELGITQEHTPCGTLVLRTVIMWVSFATGALFPMLPWFFTSSTSRAVLSVLPMTIICVVGASLIVSAMLAHILAWSVISMACLRMAMKQLFMIVVSVSLTTLLNVLVLRQI